MDDLRDFEAHAYRTFAIPAGEGRRGGLEAKAGLSQWGAGAGSQSTLHPIDLMAQYHHAHVSLHDERWHEGLNLCVAAFWFLGYSALLLKLRKDRSALGLSLQTLLALAVTEINNCLLQFFYFFWYRVVKGDDGYYLNSALWICDIPTTILAVYCCVVIRWRHFASYEGKKDNFGNRVCKLVGCVETKKKASSSRSSASSSSSSRNLVSASTRRLGRSVLYLIAAMGALPLCYLRRSQEILALSYLECFDDVLLAVALLPQLHMFYNRRPRRISSPLGWFVCCLFFARVFSLAYWITYPFFRADAIPARGLHIATESLNLLLLADFLFYFIRALCQGHKDVVLPI